ncbi:MAG: FecR family protein [Pseudomonadales bacterium]|jgi:ferric-dicitrate binding protein FerR (iron transport regulator)|nr:FecR family protein [Pseudomonadales bacterium]MDP7359855.1 FecR family protein [Pseudomonadales bacterium]MDP7595722.1 FecR family protein [Pseudomonadales bacterium]HJN49163.1 FecR family protein [Pseudomonadales bacterium]|tara:strand:+ start:4976 stop:5986 length:1011 start_codon:yes stop_codon:yes gene_type:complete
MKEEDGSSQTSQDDSIVSLMRLAGPRESLPKDVHARLEESFREALRDAQRRRRMRNIGAFSAVAAVLVVALMLSLQPEQQPQTMAATVVRMTGAVLLNSDGSSGDIRSGIAVGTRVHTGSGGRVLLSLVASSTTVRLDHATELELRSETELFLKSGSIYIDTGGVSQALSSLTVSTEFADITDVGTQYLITAASTGTTVAVREGIVRIVTDGQQIEGHAMQDAAEQLSISNTRQINTRTIQKHGGNWSWIHSIAPGFDTHNRPVIECLNWISRETGRSLQFASPAIEEAAHKVKLQGSLPQMAPEELLTEIQRATGFVTMDSEEGVILIHRASDAE